MIVVLDERLTIIQVNNQYLNLAGCTKQELLGRSVHDKDLPIISSPETLAIIRSAGKEQVISDVRYVRAKEELSPDRPTIRMDF